MSTAAPPYPCAGCGKPAGILPWLAGKCANCRTTAEAEAALRPKSRPNCLAGLAGDPPYPEYGPPDSKSPPTPEVQAERARRAAEYERVAGVIWQPTARPESTRIRRNGPRHWWLTDSDNEYGTVLTRDDLQRLRDALNKELGEAGALMRTLGKILEAVARGERPTSCASAAAAYDTLCKDIEQRLARLTFREREIIKMRHGIGDGYTYTLEEIGRVFMVTPARVRQIQNAALRKMRADSADLRTLLAKCGRLACEEASEA